MKPQIRYPIALVLLLGSVLMFRLAEHELARTGFYIFSMYIGSLVFFIAGVLFLFNLAHKIVPDDWTPTL